MVRFGKTHTKSTISCRAGMGLGVRGIFCNFAKFRICLRGIQMHSYLRYMGLMCSHWRVDVF